MKHLALSLFAVIYLPFYTFGHLPAGFAQYEVASGLNPTDMDVAADGTVFITEKNGFVRIVRGGQLLPDPFLILEVNAYNERGLGHIALDPDFADNGYFYLYYTVPDGTHNRLSRFSSSGNFAIPGSETVLYDCDNSNGSVHHGGDIVFDLDGKLVFSVGENGFGPMAQSMDSDLGKILRINRDGSIPADNPFYQTASGKYKAIYATGFRNPFSLGADPVSGLIYAADVGGQVWEELNEVIPGKNYGYPLIEGKSGGQSLPANYQDPVFTYDHNTGCAIIGASFYNPSNPAFPGIYEGKFFFADYCKGYIGRFNPVSKTLEDIFISDIPRPVSICCTASGDFYYLARAGLGGGSEMDNTASDNGSLWRVIYTGSNRPFVYGHPPSGLYTQGDTLKLQVYSTGEEPLGYQWQKNGTHIPGAQQAIYQQANLQLADSGAVFRCIVQNEYGFDTSQSAIIRVTQNKRPVPVIIQPVTGALYQGGTDIVFSGYATDQEDSTIPDSALSWKIYFYHDAHFHPAMSPINGIHEGTYPIGTTGEPDDNVWYRVFLTATDNIGLSTTTTLDLFPEKTNIQVETAPPGMPVDIDGIGGTSPFNSAAVVGLQRHIRIPDFSIRHDSVLLFREWETGETTPYLPFMVSSGPSIDFKGWYDIFPTGKGLGLAGVYLHENLATPAYLSRLDTTVNFLWGEGSPEAGNIPVDGFTVRWSGGIEPFFTDSISFHTYSDDGVRLWVNDTLLIDKWVGQPATEHTGTLWLEGGKRYNIVLEYLEVSGAATVQLYWSSKRVPKSIIPKSQLFPPQNMIPNQFTGTIWIDPNGDGTIDEAETLLEDAVVLLTNTSNPSMINAGITDQNGVFDITSIASGTYQVYVLPPLGYGLLTPGYGLQPSGYALPATFAGEEMRTSNFGFIPEEDGGQLRPKTSWSITPNPAQGEVRFIKNYQSITRDLQIRILNTAGQLVAEHISPAGEKTTTVSIVGFPRGTYIVTADGYARYLLVY